MAWAGGCCSKNRRPTSRRKQLMRRSLGEERTRRGQARLGWSVDAWGKTCGKVRRNSFYLYSLSRMGEGVCVCFGYLASVVLLTGKQVRPGRVRTHVLYLFRVGAGK